MAWTLCLVVVTAGALAGPSTAADVDEAAGQSCATRYAAALSTLRPGIDAALETGLLKLITPAGEVANRWRFWQPSPKRARSRKPDGDGILKPVVYRGNVCADETRARNGRFRCLKWLPATPERIAELTQRLPPAPPKPSRRERRDLRFLNDTIQTGGALTAFAEGGRFYWLVRRLVGDIKGYVGQPPTAALCTGARGMIAFYNSQLTPFEERIAFVQSIENRAVSRFETSLAALEAAHARWRAARQADEPQPEAPITERERASFAIGQSSRRTAAAPSLTEVVGAIARTYRRGAPPPVRALAGRASGPEFHAALDAARKVLDRDYPSDTNPVTPSAMLRERAVFLTALRHAEALYIASQTVAVYQSFKDTVQDSFDAIRRAHTRHCTCQ